MLVCFCFSNISMSSKFERQSDQLSLFASGGVDVARLRARRESFPIGRPQSARTAECYASDWKSFAAWCSYIGRQHSPATAETVADYVQWLLDDDDKKISTALRHLASIADFHRKRGLPVPAMGQAREAANHVRRERGEKPQGKTAIAVDDLVCAVNSCDTSSVAGIRNRAIIILGFATAVRRSELAALQLSDVTFEGDGLRVFIVRSKTDQEAKGRSVPVYTGQRESTDPVKVLSAWISARGDWNGPLFCKVKNDKIRKSSLTGQTVAQIVKAAVSRTGLDASRYAGHSLRSGAASASAIAGRSLQEIMLLTGHKTAAMLQVYVRDIEIWNIRNPLPNVL